MTGIRTASLAARSIFAALLALLLVSRLLSPAGFMPAFDGGAVTIVACPDFDAPAAPMPHHHGGGGDHHQPCPYAAAGAAAAPAGYALFVAVLLAIAILLVDSRQAFPKRERTRDRPPAIGPPFPA